MLGAKRLLADREGALVEWPCPRKVALGLEHVGKVVEACRSIGMLGAEYLYADRQRIAKQWCGLRVSCAPVEVLACPTQQMKDRGVISATPRQQMWRQLCAQRPRLGIVVAVL